MSVSDVATLKQLAVENSRFKRIVANLTVGTVFKWRDSSGLRKGRPTGYSRRFYLTPRVYVSDTTMFVRIETLKHMPVPSVETWD